MRYSYLAAPLALLSVSACAAQANNSQQTLAATWASCDPNSPDALVARPTHVKTTPRGHILVAASKLRLSEAKYVEGPCADEIVSFVAAHARLPSGEAFVVRDDGTVRFFKPDGIVERHDLAIGKIEGLPGYNLIMSDRLGLRRTPAGERTIYVGLFKRGSDSVIARFDVINGKPSRDAEILIRSTLPIASVEFLGAPDTPEGSIGFVERRGRGAAWLYAYSWNHGELPQLKF